MASPKSVDHQRQYETVSPERAAEIVAGQLVLLAVPFETFTLLNDEAARRGMTAAQLINISLDQYLAATDPSKRPAAVLPLKENS